MGSRKKPDLISAIPPLYPISIVNAKTGELVELDEFGKDINLLVSFVQKESERLWGEEKASLEARIDESTAKQAAEVGREIGINANLISLSRDVKAQSRIERLIRYNVITSARSYYNSDVETKKEPSFASYINLGAIDAQMATVTRIDDTHVELFFKCWKTEYLLIFKLPDYVLKRDIIKITLPTIKQWGESWVFIFNIEEKSATPVINDKYVIGIDLGRVEPFTLAVVHVSSGSRVAQYTASPRIRELVAKRDRLNQELGHMKTKSDAHKSLGFRKQVLEAERSYTRAKRNRIIESISWQIAKEIDRIAGIHKARFIALEDLSWVNPKHGMSRWTHSQDQTAIIHKLTRSGHKTHKVSPHNTSQDCSKCGGVVTHKAGKRLVVCSDCSVTLNRDVNAAVNIAVRPLHKRSKGSNCSLTGQVTTGFSRSNKRLSTSLATKTS